jgi:hypothetical protein
VLLVCVCLPVSMSVCLWACVGVGVGGVCVRARAWVCLCLSVCLCAHASVSVCICVCVCAVHVSVPTKPTESLVKSSSRTSEPCFALGLPFTALHGALFPHEICKPPESGVCLDAPTFTRARR